MKRFFLKVFPSFFFLFLFSASFAQSSEDRGPSSDDTGRIKKIKIKSLSDLQHLTPYESVSVIQKRYLPKTFRGELNLSIASVINHTFFYIGGVSLRVGFFLQEDHGFGLEVFAFAPPAFKIVTKEMADNGIAPFSIVFSQLYGGAYYKWSPVFGKFAFLNNKIIYFDMYVTLGAGMTRILNGREIIEEKFQKEGKTFEGPAFPDLDGDFFPTFSMGLGQMFALSQDWAFNWELKWQYTLVRYKDKPQPYIPMGINFSLGANYYFPGAGYR